MNNLNIFHNAVFQIHNLFYKSNKALFLHIVIITIVKYIQISVFLINF